MSHTIHCLAVFTITLAISPLAVGQDNEKTEGQSATFTKSSSKIDEGAEKAEPFSNKHFESATRLMVGEEPLNIGARQMYPSPAMFDVDGDGQNELIVGDIFGSLNVYENENDGNGDPVWSKFKPLKSADGEKIKVSNW